MFLNAIIKASYSCLQESIPEALIQSRAMENGPCCNLPYLGLDLALLSIDLARVIPEVLPGLIAHHGSRSMPASSVVDSLGPLE